MTERGLPPDGAPACPFVAFEDDRDARSTVPDHRHRCFAESRPAPRALAHQEAYCLSSAFPVCPTFQDWARREAAAARPTPVASPLPHDEAAPESYPMPPRDRDPQHPAGSDTGELPPRRNPPRDWAAPPPWTGDPAQAPAAGAMGAAAMGAAVTGGGAAGASRDGAIDDDVPAIPPRPTSPDAAAATPATGTAPGAWGAESRGLAGSAAYRLAGPDPHEPEPASPQPAAPERTTPQRTADEARAAAPGALGAGVAAAAAAGTSAAWATELPEPPVPAPPTTPAPSRQATPPAATPRPSPSQARPDDRSGGSQGAAAANGNRGRQDAAELFGPAWEAPRRYEAYPTLRTRVGLPSFNGIPKLGVAAAVILVAALFLFLFGPNLLGFGKNDQPGAGGAPTATPVVQATDTPVPTTPPPPTPQTYVVAKGDTFSKIAKKFGVTVEELKAANPQVKNIDKIQIGDQLTIPTPTPEDASAQP